MTIETTGDLSAVMEATGVIPAKTALGGGPMVERWADLGPAITEQLRKLPPEHRYRGKLVKVLFDSGIFSKAEMTGDKRAIAAITEKLAIMERQGLVKKTGKFVTGNQLWVAIGDLSVDVELATMMAGHLAGPENHQWWVMGVLEERGHKYLCVSTKRRLPHATTGGTQGVESVNTKVKYDPRWPHEGLRFSYDVPLRSEIRRQWRKDFEKAVCAAMTEFAPAPMPKIEEESVQAQDEGSVSHEERVLEQMGPSVDDAADGELKDEKAAVLDEPTDRDHHQD